MLKYGKYPSICRILQDFTSQAVVCHVFQKQYFGHISHHVSWCNGLEVACHKEGQASPSAICELGSKLMANGSVQDHCRD